jgi:cytosine deaminase
MTVEDIVARGRQTLESCIENGATRMRAHVEVDPRIGLRGFEGIKLLAREYAWAIDIEICVFPQEGLTNNPGTDELMVAALRDGARVVGAAPGYDTDHAAQIRRVFELAREFDADIDMHLDFGNTPDDMDLFLVCELAERLGWQGRVAIGHATKLSTMKLADFTALAPRIAAAGVAVTVLPATDLYLMGRDMTENVRRGCADVTLLAAHGVTCSLSTNNVLNPFTPFGDCSLIRMGNLQANVAQHGSDEDLAGIFGMLTDSAARLLRLPDYGIKVGNPADLVVVDAATPAQAIAEIRQPLAVYKRGRRTVSRHRPELHRPGQHQA